MSNFIHLDGVNDVALVSRMMAMTRRVGRDAFVKQSRMARLDGESLLRRFYSPALILCGRLAPHGRLAVIENCGHMPPMEQPKAVAQALRRWLQ